MTGLIWNIDIKIVFDGGQVRTNNNLIYDIYLFYINIEGRP